MKPLFPTVDNPVWALKEESRLSSIFMLDDYVGESTSDQRSVSKKMKQNPTLDFQRCTTLVQRQCRALKQHRNNAA